MFGNHTAPFNNAMGHVFVGGPAAGTFPGAASATFNYTFPPGATPADNAATFQNNIWSKFTSFSASLASRTANSTFTAGEFVPGGLVGAGAPAIFDVTLAQLNAFTGTLGFGGCLASTVATPCDAVINVTGTGTFTQALSYGFGKAQPNLIWNFENATDVEINNQWFPSILAPEALVHNTAAINGNLIAKTFGGTAPIGSGELHLPAFDCSDNLCAVTMPEPGLAAAARLRARLVGDARDPSPPPLQAGVTQRSCGLSARRFGGLHENLGKDCRRQVGQRFSNRARRAAARC